MSTLLAAAAVAVLVLLLLPRRAPAQRPAPPAGPPAGVAALVTRAEHIFWRWVEARKTGDREPLVDLCLGYPRGDGPTERLCLQQIRLDQVALRKKELVARREEEGREVADVRLLWTASVEGQDPEDIEHVFTLVEKDGEWLLMRVAMPEEEWP